MEHEITARGALHGPDGRLREPGWARSLLLDYSRSSVAAPAWRIKEWDYYCVLADDFALALTVADNGYMGFLSASVLDFSEPGHLSESAMTPFPLGRMGLPASSAEGVTEAVSGGIKLRFEAKDGTRKLSVSWPGFGAKSSPRPSRGCCGYTPPDAPPAGGLGGGVGLEAELTLREIPGGDSMVIATPFPGAPSAFYYNQKINCQEAEGSYRLGGVERRFERGKAFGVLDWGRGVWTYSNTWYWASASGLAAADGDDTGPFGFNLGCGFGDTSAATENMVFYRGKAHKLGRVSFELDHRDFMKSWRVFSDDGRLDLELRPLVDRSSSTDLMLIASIQHQVFGSWQGKVRLDDGRQISIDGLKGFAEKVVNRW